VLGSGAAGSIATADFTGDGTPDLAVTDDANNTLTVLSGVGTASIIVHPPIVLAGSPRSIGADDFNDDGKPDVAIADVPEGKVSVLLGDGHGGFQPTGTPVEAGPSPQMLAAGTFVGLVLTPTTCCAEIPGEVAVVYPTPAPPETMPPPISHPQPVHSHPPTTAQIRSTLLRALKATRRTIGVRWLLRHRRYSFHVRAPAAGRVTIGWSATKSEARRAHARSLLIAITARRAIVLAPRG
jgi:hypothetical protein